MMAIVAFGILARFSSFKICCSASLLIVVCANVVVGTAVNRRTISNKIVSNFRMGSVSSFLGAWDKLAHWAGFGWAGGGLWDSFE